MTLIYIKQSLNSPSNMMHGCRIVSRKGIDHITCILIFWFCLGFFFWVFFRLLFVCLFTVKWSLTIKIFHRSQRFLQVLHLALTNDPVY